MKKQNRLAVVIALVAVVASITVVVALWQTRPVNALEDSKDRPLGFGFVDLGAGQTARLNVVNTNRNPRPETENRMNAHRVRLAIDIYIQRPPEPDAPTCVTRYRFLRRESCDVTLMPGEAASFEFTAAEDTKVAASIHSLGGPDTREGGRQLTPEPHLAPMLEVREAARTVFVVPGVAKGFNPQPDPPGGP